MTPDIARVAALIREVAAEEIVPRFQNLEAHDLHEKRPGNYVTTADLAAEARLINGLAVIAPQATVVAEEMAEADVKGILSRLSGDDPVWVIDPVDGTANFADGKTPFAVIISYVDRGVTRAGWLFDVMEGTMVSAEEGAGAYKDGTRVRAAKPAVLKQLIGYMGQRLRNIPELTAQLGPIRSSRCSGRDHMNLALGTLHYAVFRRTWPWDHAAGALIHREAGGYNAAWDGTPYSAAGVPEQGLLLAPDAETWRKLRDLVGAHSPR